MFWIESAGIARCSMDGTNRRLLLASPGARGLVLDHNEGRLYWSQFSFIHSVGVDGLNHQVSVWQLLGKNRIALLYLSTPVCASICHLLYLDVLDALLK